MNWKIINVCFCLFFLGLFSCTTKKGMEVIYIDDDMETSAPLNDFNYFVGLFKNVEEQKMLVPAAVLDSIYYGFEKTGIKDFFIPNCRMRVDTSIGQIFIDDRFCAFTKDSDSIRVSPRVIFLLKKYSGYYNRMEKEYLKDCYDSRYFNLLEGYEYKPSPKLSPVFTEFRVKVILYREN